MDTGSECMVTSLSEGTGRLFGERPMYDECFFKIESLMLFNKIIKFD